MATSIKVTDFSPILFWDVAADNVDLEKHRPWLIKRVLEKGRREDWITLRRLYSTEDLRESFRQLPSLERRATAFARAVLDLEQTELRCSKNRQSPNAHWAY